MDLLVTDGSSSKISDQIKDILFQKSAANIDAIRPEIAASLFGDDVDFDSEPTAEADFDQDVEIESEEEVEAG